MTQLYLLVNGEQRGPYSLEQLRAMYLAGAVTSDAFYWQEGLAEWLPIDELFAPPIIDQPSTYPAETEQTARVEQPKKTPYLTLLVLVGIAACIIIGFYLFNKYQENSARQQAEVVKQQRQIPLEITRAINNLSSATSTGVNQETYTNLVIELKSAVSTYGQSLPSDEAKLLGQIVDTYDIGVQLWDKSQIDGDRISIVVLDISADSELDAMVKSLGVPTQLVAVYNENDTTHHQYVRTDALSRLWTLNDSYIKLLNAGVDNKDIIEAFYSQASRDGTAHLEPKADARQTGNLAPESPKSSSTDSIDASGVCGLPWGASQAEVIATLESKGYVQDVSRSIGNSSDSSLSFSGMTLYGFHFDAGIIFHEGKMCEAVGRPWTKIRGDFSATNQKALEKLLTDKYGKPQISDNSSDSSGEMLSWYISSNETSIRVIFTTDNDTLINFFHTVN